MAKEAADAQMIALIEAEEANKVLFAASQEPLSFISSCHSHPENSYARQ